jgi:two-component system, chemotaxis family, chemotaxis protein CheY
MRILIVDDVTAVRQFLQLALGEFRRATVDQAADGVQALKFLRQHKYDLVLLDLNMPLLDGFKVLSVLRQEETSQLSTPVILVSTLHSEDVIERAQRLGVRHFVPKPVRAHVLQEAIRSALGLVAAPPKIDQVERRNAVRAGISVEVELGTALLTATTSDVSPFGAFVVTDHIPAVGTVLNVTLKFPHLAEPIRTKGCVVHIRTTSLDGVRNGFAVRFDLDDPEVRERLLKAFDSPEEP